MTPFNIKSVGEEHLTEVTCSCCKKAKQTIYTEGVEFDLDALWEQLKTKGWKPALGGTKNDPACPDCFASQDKAQMKLF